jgi:hypothetical protein
MSKSKKIKRMQELMEPIDRQIMMCDDSADVLMLASIMMTTARRIMVNHIGEEQTEQVIIDVAKGKFTGDY